MSVISQLQFGSNLRPSLVSVMNKMNDVIDAVNTLGASDNTADITALQTRCTNLETQNTTISDEITTINTNATTQQTDIDNIKTTLTVQWFIIHHDAGLLDLQVTGCGNVFWKFPDGTTSTSSRPKKTVAAGITYLYATEWWGQESKLTSNYVVQTALKCSLKDIPPLANTLNLNGCSQVTGSLADAPRVTNFLSLYNCSQITGVLSPTATLKTICLSGTGMTPSDTDQTIINLAAITTVTSGGTLQIRHNRTSASDAAVSALAGKFTIT